MQLARDKVFERLRKLKMGKNTHRVCEISKRHLSAINLSPSSITQLENDKWKVSSETRNTDYVVEKMQEQCECKVKCKECDICPHMYVCSCLDATLHATVCKHVHLVEMTYNQHTNKPISTTETTEIDYDYFTNIMSQEKNPPNLLLTKTKFLQHLTELEMIAKSCTNQEAILAATKHVRAAMSIIKALESQKEEKRLTMKRKHAPNQNMEKQLKFYSTKRKRLVYEQGLTKPSLGESEQCKEKLNTEPIFCGCCLKENDINHDNTTIEWIQCDICSIWLHLSCAQPQLTKPPNNFTCHFCQS